MKDIIAAVSLGLLALTACNNPQSNQQSSSSADQPQATQQAVPSIGGDKDEHGCLTAAGETWSELRQSCLQIFNAGIRLNPVEPREGEAVFSAFALYNDDQSKVEIHLPDAAQKSYILEQSEAGVYRNDTYRFNGREQALYINEQKQFQASE